LVNLTSNNESEIFKKSWKEQLKNQIEAELLAKNENYYKKTKRFKYSFI